MLAPGWVAAPLRFARSQPDGALAAYRGAVALLRPGRVDARLTVTRSQPNGALAAYVGPAPGASLGFGGAPTSLLPPLGQVVQAVAALPPAGVGGAASVLPALGQSAGAVAVPPAYAGGAGSVLPGLGQSAGAVAVPPVYAGGAASVLPGLGQSAGGIAVPPAYAAGGASVLAPIGQFARGDAPDPVGISRVPVVLFALGQVDPRLQLARAQPEGALAAYLGPAVAVAGPLRGALRLVRLVTAGLALTRRTRVQMFWDGRPVERMEDVMQGEAVRIALTFSDAAGAPVVVGGATLRAKPPNAAARDYPLTATGVMGEWAATVLFDAPGRWWIEGDCISPTPAVTPSLIVTVRPRAVPPT